MIIKDQEDILSDYKSRVRRFAEDLSNNNRLSTRYSYLRLAIFLIAIPGIYLLTRVGFLFLIIGVVVFAILFVQAVLKQQKHEKLAKRSENLIAINENEISNILHFQNLYYDGIHFKAPHHLYSDDLDIFGPNSLFHLINRANTYDGVHYLKDSLLRKPDKIAVYERQEGIKELENKVEWRQDFANTLFNIEGGHHRNLAQEIDEELKLDLGFAVNKTINTYLRVLPFLWIGVVFSYFVNVDIANSLATILIFFNLFLTLRKYKDVTNVQNHLSRASIMLRSYKDALSHIFDEEWNSPILKTSVANYRSKSLQNNSVAILSELQNIIEHLDYRLNLIPALILNGIVLWDFRVLSRLSRWRKEHKGKLRELFEFVGQLEGLSSLACFAYNQPEYDYPSISDHYFSLEASDIKHPLIPKDENVGNDFNIQVGKHLNIITGSNMSGKSTLLRTIGINIILGYTGTKVAAKSFSYPIVTLISYMRIKDILEESVSTFKAELNRIQLILDLLKSDSNCFILIDEMLRGTNSKDKLTGSIGIARRLLAEQTYAMIATHDIKLAEMGIMNPEEIANYYFDIDYADGDLVFDYKVKPGICENFNASFLLNQLGIEMEQ